MAVLIDRVTHREQLEAMVPMMRRWHAESQFQHLPFSVAKFIRFGEEGLNRGPRGAIFHAIKGEVPLGVIDLAVGEGFLTEGGCFATCLGWFVDPTIRATLLHGRVANGLFDAAKNWARSAGASELMIHGTHGVSPGLARRGVTIGANIVVYLDEGHDPPYRQRLRPRFVP